MPDDRFFHKRAGHSERVAKLTDFEELVWRYYVLSSDDFGVMRFDPKQIRADHARAGARSERAVMKALDRVRDVELVYVFDHQGQAYCYSRNWQRYQKIEYPRDTSLPRPLEADLRLCEPSTAELFMYHPGGNEGKEIRRLFAQLSANDPQIDSKFLLLTRARALAQAKATGSGSGLEGGPGETVARRGMGSGVMAGALPRDHVKHAHCGRVCVPEFLHSEFTRKVGGGNADAVVRQFYVAVLDSIPDLQPIGDDPLKFWRAQFAARFGSVTPSTNPRTAGNVAAAERFIARGGGR